MKKQVHIRGTLMSKLQVGKPAEVFLEDHTIIRTTNVIRFVDSPKLVWFETQNTWYCLEHMRNGSRLWKEALASIQVTDSVPIRKTRTPSAAKAV